MNKQRKAINIIMLLVIIISIVIPAFADEATSPSDFATPSWNQYTEENMDIPYGAGTLYSDGCGLCSVTAIIYNFYKDDSITPQHLAKIYGDARFPVEGIRYAEGNQSIALDILAIFGIKAEPAVVDGIHNPWNQVEEALREGKVVLCRQNKGIFTQKDHFIALMGISEYDGVFVADSNANHWYSYEDQFRNGFVTSDVWANASGYWICSLAE